MKLEKERNNKIKEDQIVQDNQRENELKIIEEKISKMNLEVVEVRFLYFDFFYQVKKDKI